MPNNIKNIIYFDPKTKLGQTMMEVANRYIESKESLKEGIFRYFYPVPEGLDDGEDYRWRVMNWGTKWDAYEVSQEHVEKDGNIYYCLTFWTAWSAPVGVLSEIANEFEDDGFFGEFADEDIGYNTGYYQGACGSFNIDYLPANTPEATGHAIRVWGIQKDYEFNGGNYIYKG